jgi:murein L,D-transpeptidase YcbB/YkuD
VVGRWAPGGSGRTAILAGLAILLAAGAACAAQPAAPPSGPIALPPPPAPPPLPPRPLTQVDGEAIWRAIQAAPEFPAPANLDGAVAAMESPNPRVRSAAGAALARAAMVLAQEEHGLPSNPAAVDPDWALRGAYDANADFAQARQEGRIPAWAAALPRHNPAYLSLVAAQRRYGDIAAHGGWPSLPAGLSLRPGAKNREVPNLRQRLAIEGYGQASPSIVYDHALAAEVSEFQARHGLKETGVVDAKTLAALDVPAEARLASINANLQRERWLPDSLPPDRIIADVAGAEVTLYQDDQPTLTMRSVVGEPTKPTPLFVSYVQSIEFNPPWHVPADIAKKELLPKGSAYLAKHGFSMINGQLVQAAGPQSSLGRIKFDMPDSFAVYLHDTDSRNLFAVDSRGRSHGCVRLQKPNDLAVALLSDQGWTLEKVNDAIDAGDTHWVRPTSHTPVYLVYRTAEAPDDGPAIFRPDLYGWDDRLNAALAAAPR